MRLLLILLICCFALGTRAQNLKPIVALMEAGSYAKAFAKLEKAKRKQPSNPAVFYYLSQYYNTESAPQYNADSAAFYATAAQSIFYQLSAKEAAAMEAQGISGAMLDAYKAKLDSQGYARATQSESPDALKTFLRYHSNAYERNDALRLLADTDFEKALQANTVQAYLNFLEHHPRSAHAPEARKRYHRLVYEAKTQRNSLAEYLDFIASHPDSPHKPDAELQIFRIYNLAHDMATYEQFLAEFPTSLYAGLAKSWLNALSRQEEALAGRMIGLEGASLGILTEEAFMPIAFVDSLPENVRCAGLVKPTLCGYRQGKAGLFNWRGEEVLPFIYEELLPIEGPLWMARQNGKWGLAHAWGAVLADCHYDAIEPFSENMLKVQQGGLWGLISANGYPVLPCIYEQIAFDPPQLVVLTNANGQMAFLPDEVLLADQTPDIQWIDSYTRINEEWLIGQSQNMHYVWSIGGEQLLPASSKPPVFAQNAWLLHLNNQWHIYTLDGNKAFEEGFDNAQNIPYCCAVQKDGLWGIADPKGFYLMPPAYEHIAVLGEQSLALLKNGQTKVVHPAEESFSTTAKPVKALQMRVEQDQAIFPKRRYMTEHYGLFGLLDENGMQLLPAIYQRIEPWGDTLLLLRQNGRYGLANGWGKLLLPAIYDAIVSEGNGVFSVLQQGKFGLFYKKGGGLPKTAYDAAPRKMGKYFVVQQNKRYGLIDAQGQPIAPFIFQEIHHWSAEAILVKYQDYWGTYSLKSNQFDDFGVQSLEVLLQHEQEVVARTYHATKGYGLRSSALGVVAKEQYTFIQAMGTLAHYFYLAEKYDMESKNYQIAYFSRDGRIFRTQTLTKEAYERIACK